MSVKNKSKQSTVAVTSPNSSIKESDLFIKIGSAPSAAPVLLEEIIRAALNKDASDIHLEPGEKEAVVRFRIDGVLNTVGRIAPQLYTNLLNLIKLRAHLRSDEHYTPQDGAARLSIDGETLDLRLSIVPVLQGEKIAIRIQTSYAEGLTLENLGLSNAHMETLRKAAKKPFGMILATGPTGSGKTTTLYTMLKLLNDAELNITTIEDPVEYEIKGINQIQIRPTAGLTFGKGLRSIVRQDPNVILVGEVRDSETAELAVNAALTGHLLLSSFHANDSSTSIPRLLDMGIEPFILASTLELVVAQRLVRKICQNCKQPHAMTHEELKALFPKYQQYIKKEQKMFAGKGCAQCGNTGYRGRTGIFELIELNREMRELILKNPSSSEVWQTALKAGSSSLFEDGIEKVINGETTLHEVLKVAEPRED